MTGRFMISVAALALIAGTGFANGQGTGMSREGSSGGSTMQSAPPSAGSSAGQMNHESPDATSPDATKSPSGMKATQSEQKPKSMSSDDGTKGGAKDRNAEGRNGNMNAESKGAAENRSQTTTGQAGAGAKLSTEQRTRVTTVIRGQHIAPVNNVNFAISVGTRVPREVSFHPLPAEVVTVYPEWRGYEFFLVRDQIVVVDPATLEIVAVLEA